MSYYIAPRFLDKLSVHITKNYLNLPNVKVPLLLGVHGRKGEGKSFQCDLVFEQMGVEAVYMSAGELESPDAGDPARLVRLRYLEAGELAKVRGKMAVLMINDIDAGMGRVDQFTQYTVNTQLVHGTLMNIADNPTNVQLPGSYNTDPTPRVPIIVTGNDLATLYAPLVRDGRMDKFYWEPDRGDRIGIVSGIFEVDRVDHRDIEKLVDTFPEQSIDFYGALRSRLYDEQVRQLIEDVGINRISQRVVNSTQAPPEFRKPDFSLPHLVDMGQALVREQKRLQELRLVEEYNRTIGNRGLGEINMTAPQSNSAKPAIAPPSTISYNGQPSSTRLSPELVSQVNQILGQGHRLGIEYVDERRFRMNSWNCYAMFQDDGSGAIAALESCLNEHQNDYVRLVGISSSDRRRVVETIVHRPIGKAVH
ncbi:ribulose bisphosphate carboxylase small subunit [Myxacorys almedinensis]|uniref:AAA family ATPase n=1 Tax=Myxacorys almedinensis A TaxID=2690445 RepID=A0A8J7YWB8_9CYAN|nr:ribulose bisphosphate carboxylase small subunit [Myxacorys almedinensis]NDJ15817.1 AAA family ATPase [Myxacorys almedinensis A]